MYHIGVDVRLVWLFGYNMDWFIITKQKSYLMGFAMAYFKHTGTSCAVAIVTNVKITFSANYISFVLRIE